MSVFSSIRESLVSSLTPSKMPPPADTPEKGDKVSWSWNGAAPSGEVAEKKTDGEVSVTSKRGNTITKTGEPSDPAIAIERSGNDVVKKTSEVEVEEKGKGKKGATKSKTPKKRGAADEKKADDQSTDKHTETPKKGTKRQADNSADQSSAKRGRGRPKGSSGTAKRLRDEKPTRVSTREKKEPENLINQVFDKPARKHRAKKAKAAEKGAAPSGKKRGRPAASGAGKPKEKRPKAESKAKVTKAKAAPKTKAVGPDGKLRGRGRPPKAK